MTPSPAKRHRLRDSLRIGQVFKARDYGVEMRVYQIYHKDRQVQMEPLGHGRVLVSFTSLDGDWGRVK
jgi:hypothetical protein